MRHGPSVLVSLLAHFAAVHILEIRVVDVQSIGADTDIWTILFVQLLDSPDIGSVLHDIVLALTPELSAL